jgi:hypothetical protein
MFTYILVEYLYTVPDSKPASPAFSINYNRVNAEP